jgi:hypothetical protein
MRRDRSHYDLDRVLRWHQWRRSMDGRGDVHDLHGSCEHRQSFNSYVPSTVNASSFQSAGPFSMLAIIGRLRPIVGIDRNPTGCVGGQLKRRQVVGDIDTG